MKTDDDPLVALLKRLEVMLRRSEEVARLWGGRLILVDLEGVDDEGEA